MPLLSFSVFKDKILSGAKRHTIRARRKNPIKVGDKLYMWWKSRSPKEKEKLGEAKCIRVNPVDIDDHAVCVFNPENFYDTKLDKKNLVRVALCTKKSVQHL